MKIIMYHYVRNYRKELPFFNFLHVEDFIKQLDYFDEKYGFARKPDFIKSLENRSFDNLGDKVILTFDDGLLDHYQYVYPELIKRGLWGIFFLNSKPFFDFKVLNVHSIHHLCGMIEDRELAIILNQYLKDYKVNELYKDLYANQFNSNPVHFFKATLNYHLPNEVSSRIIDSIMVDLNINLSADKIYLNIKNIKEMIQGGMIFGAHGHSHTLLNNLNSSDQFIDISSSMEFIMKFCEESNFPPLFCYPYGGKHSYNNETINTLKKLGVNYAFDVNSNDLHNKLQIESDWNYFIPRYDCNFFPNGSVFDFSAIK